MDEKKEVVGVQPIKESLTRRQMRSSHQKDILNADGSITPGPRYLTKAIQQQRLRNIAKKKKPSNFRKLHKKIRKNG